jgi:hypothetical protein
MDPQHVSLTWWAFATLGWEPGAEARAALEAAVARVAPDMIAQDVTNTIFAHANLMRMPEVGVWTALEAAAVRVGPTMIAQARGLLRTTS